MRNAARKLILFVALMQVLLVPQDNAYARDDWNLWLSARADVFQHDNYKLSLYHENRFRDDMTLNYFQQSKLINQYTFTENFQAAVSYSFIRIKSTNDQWRDEHRPEIELLPKTNLGPFTLDNRVRFELRDIANDNLETRRRFRDRLQLTYPFELLAAKIKAYINHEFFFEYPADQWNQTRSFIGLQFPFHLNLAYGMQRVKASGDWTTRQVLGLGTWFAF